MHLSKAADSLAKYVSGPVTQILPPTLRETLLLRTFGLLKVPMLLFVSPSVVEITDEKCVIKIRLNRRTKNHLNSLYFGSLAAGADCAGGLIAMRLIQSEGN